jgi:hypothetical protein
MQMEDVDLLPMLVLVILIDGSEHDYEQEQDVVAVGLSGYSRFLRARSSTG